MPTPIEPANIHFNAAGMPVSDAFDDIYFSNLDGAAESDFVFLQGNRLTDRFNAWPSRQPFVIAETGFGTGLNLLLASQLFLATAPADAKLHLISFERYPLTVAQIRLALTHWPHLASLCDALLSCYPPLVTGAHRVYLHPRIQLDLHFGDVLETLPSWARSCPGKVHAWFLDGFAPRKNPQMWQPSVYDAMALSAAPTCTLATFTAVGDVRRGLIQAGFAMTKTPGFGRKRDMLIGHKMRPGAPRVTTQPRRIAIVGGGIASACLVRLLEEYGDHAVVKLFCADTQLGQGASGNPQGAIYPLLQADYTPTTQFYNQAYVYALTFYQRYCPEQLHQCGVLQLGFNDKMRQRQQRTLERTQYPADFVRAVTVAQARAWSGVAVDTGGLYFPTGGWLAPQMAIESLLAGTQADVLTNTQITSIVPSLERRGWQVNGFNQQTQRRLSETFDDVIIANGAALNELNQAHSSAPSLTIRPVGGQVTQTTHTEQSEQLKVVICHKGYLMPAQATQHCVGATYTRLNAANMLAYHAAPNAERAQDDLKNLQLTHAHTPLRFAACTSNRRAVRATTPDHLPLVGRHPNYIAAQSTQALGDEPSGVWVLGGLGSRGLTSAPWCAALLVDKLFKRPLAVDARVLKAIDSQRQFG